MEPEAKYNRKLMTLDDLLSLDVRVEWAVEGVFPSEGIGIICAMPGSFKSWMLHDLALAVAFGRPWLGRFITFQGPVLYIDEENPRGLLHLRFSKMLGGRPRSNQLADVDFLSLKGFTLTDTQDELWLEDVLQSNGYRLVIVDSLIRVHRQDENSATEMAKVFRVIRRLTSTYSTLFVMADHLSKPGPMGGAAVGMPRGSTDKTAAVDSVLSMGRRSGKLVVTHIKSRHAKPVDSFCVEVVDIGEDFISVTANDMPVSERSSKIGRAIKHVLDRLDAGDRSRQELIGDLSEESFGVKHVDEALRQLHAEGRIELAEITSEGRGRPRRAYSLVPDKNEGRHVR